MALKRKGILAEAGDYEGLYKGLEELKVIARDQSRGIPITLGHPKDRVVGREDFIGIVTPYWNEEEERLDGDFWFYDEHLHKIPPELVDKLQRNLPVGISHGYKYRLENGAAKDMFVSHVALLRPNQEGICPLDTCGVNVRLESDSHEYRYEMASELKDRETDVEPEIEEKSTQADTKGDAVGFNEVQLAQIRDLLSSLVPSPPVQEEPVVEQEPQPEMVTPTVEQPPKPTPEVKPARVIPKSQPDPQGMFETDGDTVIVYRQIAGNKKD